MEKYQKVCPECGNLKFTTARTFGYGNVFIKGKLPKPILITVCNTCGEVISAKVKL